HLPAFFNSRASRISLRLSSLEASRKPQVLITMASARSASGVTASPSPASRPSIRSLSTRFLGQPRLTNATDRTAESPDLPDASRPAGRGREPCFKSFESFNSLAGLAISSPGIQEYSGNQQG